MFMLMEMHAIGSMATLDNTKGSDSQIARDSTNGDLYIKHGSAWQKVQAGGSTPTPVGLAITVKNSSGSKTRSLTETNGIVTLAATDAIVANADSLVLNNHSGTVSSGNAGLNSPAVANVAAGVVTNVQAAA
jgi:hypothetical protein